MSKRNKGRRLLPNEVLEKEKKFYDERRKGAGVRDGGPPVGIALSGGGIRSATFNLGILQALANKDTLKFADYLSTVSGGGYIGSCLTSLFSRRSKHNDDEEVPIQAQCDQFPDLNENFPLSEPDQIHHLRRHGNFLIAREGFLRRDAMRALGNILTGITISLSTFIAIIFAVAAALVIFATSMGGKSIWYTKEGGLTSTLFDPSKIPQILSLPISGAWQFCILGSIIGMIVAGTSLFSYRRSLKGLDVTPKFKNETVQDFHERKWLVKFSILVVAMHSVAMAIITRYNYPQANASIFLAAAIVFVGMLVGAWVVYAFQARRENHWKPMLRSFANASQSIIFFGLILSLFFVGLLIAVSFLKDYKTEVGTLGIITLVISRLLVLRQSPSRNSAMSKIIISAASRILLAIAAPLLIVTALVFATMVITSLDRFEGNELSTGGAALAIASVLAALLLLRINFNRISPHYFYHDRLVETYLTTESDTKDGLGIKRNDEGILLTDLHDKDTECPYHLIQCAVNLPGSRSLARRDRKSDHFVFSKYFCGSNTTGFIPTDIYRDGKTTLARAMTISGAAASSLMGFHSSLATTFALTIFNIRLGYWMPNPLGNHKETFLTHPNHYGSFHPAKDNGVNCEKDDPSFQWPRFLLEELLGTASERRNFVNLSDGGHTGDNLGLYPLLQRRCKLVIVGDGEADPDYTFGSLSAAIRQIFTDENVKVDIDPRFVKPNHSKDSKLPERHFLIGKITYPDDVDYDGWLIVIKSAFTNKDESMPTKSYAAKNTKFPHQTTADQFFDDDQFEAYRSLGYTSAESLIKFLENTPNSSEPEISDPIDEKLPEDHVTSTSVQKSDQLISSCERFWESAHSNKSVPYSG